MPQVPTRYQPPLPRELTLQLVRVSEMPDKRRASSSVSRTVDDPASGGDSPQVGPSIITVTVWMDREPEVDSPLADWLTEAALYRAAWIVTPWEESEEQEEA